MSSAITVAFEDGFDETVDPGDWQDFCARHRIVHSPRTAGGRTYYADDVQVTVEDDQVTFSTYCMGNAMPEVARIARRFWVRFGGSVDADEEMRPLFAKSKHRKASEL